MFFLDQNTPTTLDLLSIDIEVLTVLYKGLVTLSVTAVTPAVSVTVSSFHLPLKASLIIGQVLAWWPLCWIFPLP